MHTLIGLLVVLLVGGALSTLAGVAFVKSLPAFETGLAMGTSIGIGYLMASAFLRWRPVDGLWTPRLFFPAVVGALAVVSAFIGLGPLLGWAYSASLIPAHAGMSGWLLGIVGSTVVIALVLRLLDRFRMKAVTEPDPTSRERTWARAAGVILLLLLMTGQAVAGPVILRSFGPDASYQSGIVSLARSVAFLVPIVTLAGFLVERITRGRDDRRRWLAVLWIGVALVAAGELAYRYETARSWEHARGWMEHGSPGR